jgi:preprotein translocase subunit SecG
MLNALFVLSGIPNTTNMTYETQVAVKIALLIAMACFSIAMIVIVMMQRGTNENLGVITGVTDTYYGKHKAKTNEGRLKKITFALFSLIIVTSIIYFVITLVDVGVAV